MDRTEDKDGFSILRSSLVRIFVRMLQEVSDLWCEFCFVGTGKPTGAGGTSMERGASSYERNTTPFTMHHFVWQLDEREKLPTYKHT